MTSDRRTFIKRAALGTALGATVGTVAHAAPLLAPGAEEVGTRAGGAPARALDATLAAAVGDAVLPESLGAPARGAAIASFLEWIADYRPVSEEMHGYGDAEITYSPPDPGPGWNAQLAALDLLARAKHRRGFAALSVVRRRELLVTQLARVPGTRLPSNPLSAPHVAVAIMAHWAASSDATDLAYGARIGAGNCRVLAETTRRPLPLADGGER